MEKYTIRCTEQQTRKALELGAPIEMETSFMALVNRTYFDNENKYVIIPTTEQMIGWLEEHIDNIDVLKNNDGKWVYLFYPTSNSSTCECKNNFLSRKEATLAAIDLALDYLSNNKSNET